jgi:catechol 2,3-dioxygenase-like lactoylglutathione lyase family enzyme
VAGVVGFDHVALPTDRPAEMLRFYRALGFGGPDPAAFSVREEKFFSVHFGDQKINFHGPELWRHEKFDLRGPAARPGCGDLCFVWEGGLDALHERLEAAGAEVEAGPMDMVGGRDGGRGRGPSIYTRDPDRNLIEFILYEDS